MSQRSALQNALQNRNRRLTSLLWLTAGLAGLSPVMADEAAVYSGLMISSEPTPALPANAAALAGLGRVDDPELALALHHLGYDPDTEEYAEITGAVGEFLGAGQLQSSGVEAQDFIMMYQPCMMRMVTATSSMVIRMPPDSGVALMETWDSAEREGFVLELERKSGSSPGASDDGEDFGVRMTPTGATDTLIGYDAEEYAFESSGTQGGAMAGMATVKTTGTTWIGEEVTGEDIVGEFYENFSNQIGNGQGDNSVFGGMIRNIVGMLQHGIPLHTVQTTQSNVRGMNSRTGRSESWISGTFIMARDDEECSATTIPEGFSVTQMDSAMMGAAMGAGAGSPGTTGNACDCSCEAFEKMQAMGQGGNVDGSDPEARAMAMCMMQCTSQFMACAMGQGR